MTDYTPEKVDEEIATAQKAVWSEIHGHDATRRYSVGEVKQLVYSLDNAFSSALTALTAVSAELDRERVGSKPHRPSARAWASIVERAEDAEADRDRLHKAISEALDWRDEAYHGAFGKGEFAQGYGYARRAIGRILRAALDKEGNDDE